MGQSARLAGGLGVGLGFFSRLLGRVRSAPTESWRASLTIRIFMAHSKNHAITIQTIAPPIRLNRMNAHSNCSKFMVPTCDRRARP